MQKRGTGFTNVSKILEANKGNKLAQTVSGGIQSSAQNVKTGIQQAREKFQDEANKNRLDTDEAKEKRAGVLGRFDQSKYEPDMNTFAPSTGLSSSFEQKKTALQQQQEQQAQARQAQEKAIQDRIAADQAARQKIIDQRNALSQDSFQDDTNLAGFGYNNETAEQKFRKERMRLEGDRKRYDASLKALTGAGSTLGSVAQQQQAQAEKEAADLQAMYDKQFKSEQDSWRQQQIDDAMAANLPTEQELADFSKYRTGTYKGPTELQDAGTLFSKAQQSQELGNLARSGSGGQQEILRRFVGGRDYTSGERKLDATLLGQDGNQLGAAARQTRGLVDDTSRANTQASELAKEYVGRAQIFGNETRDMLDQTANPLLQQVDARVGQLSQAEQQRKDATSRLQQVLAGEGDFGQLDSLARTGIALQDAQNLGYLSQDEVAQLTNQGGLVERGMKTGLDINKLLAERIKQTEALGLDRVSGATEAQRTSLAALDKLRGKLDSESEFARDREFTEGRTRFDLAALQDYISKTEAEKGIQGPSSSGQAAPGSPNYLGQAMAGATGQITQPFTDPLAMSDAAITNPLSMFGGSGGMTDAVTGSVNNSINNATNMAVGSVGATQQMQSSALQNILKLAGGNSKTAEQLMRAQSMYDDLTNQGLGEVSGASRALTSSIAQAGEGVSEISKGNITSGVKTLVGSLTNAPKEQVSKVLNSVGKSVSTALGGGSTGNWATEKFKTIDATTGKKVAIGSYANKSSQDLLKQITSQHQLGKTASRGNSGHEGAKALLKLIDYYNQAVAREAQYKVSDETKKDKISYDPKDVESFMNRLKASSYNYKDEVKDSPLASKNREIGVMAQDLEKSKLGKDAVKDTSMGKVVDYDNLGPKMMASIANLNARLKDIEKK